MTMATVWAPGHSVLTLRLSFLKQEKGVDNFVFKSERTHFLLFKHRQFTCKVGHLTRNERSKDVEGSLTLKEGMLVSVNWFI